MYLNNLDSKFLEIRDARNARSWEMYMKDEDNYVEWSKWCNQQEEEFKKNTETFSLMTKDNTDKNSVDNSNM